MLLLVTSLLFAADPTMVESAGRLDHAVARCAAFGWEADNDERVARLEQLILAHPGQPREDIVREFAFGTRYAFSREGEAAAGATTSEAKADWTAEIEAHCDQMARDHPRLLRRTPETASRWARILADEP